MTGEPEPPEGDDGHEAGQPSPWYRNVRVVAVAVPDAVVVGGVAAWLRADWEDAYLDELAERGHEDRFTTETEAVNHAETLWAEIGDGGRAEGDVGLSTRWAPSLRTPAVGGDAVAQPD